MTMLLLTDTTIIEEGVEESLVSYVPIMPRFPIPEHDSMSYQELREASNKALLKFVYSNLRYPPHFCGEGLVIAQFVVRKNGEIEDIKILRDIGASTCKEVVRIIELMPKWIPGEEFGKPVDVRFNLPVRFRLTD